MKKYISIIFIFFSSYVHAQSLLKNGSFENYSSYWYNRVKPNFDSCDGRSYKSDYLDLFFLDPAPPLSWWPQDWVWHHPIRSCNCKTNFKDRCKAYHGSTCFGFNGSSNQPSHVALKTFLPLKKGNRYVVSFYTNLEDTCLAYMSSKYRTPMFKHNGLGFFLSSTRPQIAEPYAAVFPKQQLYQMQKMQNDRIWMQNNILITTDSNYNFITFGIFDSSYHVTKTSYFKPNEYKDSNNRYLLMFLDSINLKPFGLLKPEIQSVPAICTGKLYTLINKNNESVGWLLNDSVIAVDSVCSFRLDKNSKIIAFNSQGNDTISIVPDTSPIAPQIQQSDYFCKKPITLSAISGIYDSLMWLPDLKKAAFISINDTMQRQLILYKGKNCKDTITYSVKHMCNPDLAKDTTICTGDNITVQNLTGEAAYWTINDTAKGLLFSIQLKNLKKKTIITAENLKGKDSIYIYVTDSCKSNSDIYIPTAFTPDGNGLNDNFGPLFQGKLIYHLIVYNIWGEKVFDNKNESIPWKGGNCSQGIYIYRLKIQLQNKLLNYQGKIILIR